MIKKAKNGFTLVELIIVIAIIGILAAVMLPQIAQVNISAQEKKVVTLFTGIGTGIRQFIPTGTGTITDDSYLAMKTNKLLDPDLALTPYDPTVPFTAGAGVNELNSYGQHVASTTNTDGMFVSKGKDQWKNPIYIRIQNLGSSTLIMMKSFGPDGANATDDDITGFIHQVKGYTRMATLGLTQDRGDILNVGTMDRSVDIFTLKYNGVNGTTSNSLIAPDFEVTD